MFNFLFKIVLFSFLVIPNIYAQDNFETKISITGNYNQERELLISVYSDNEEFYSFNKKLKPHYSIPKTFILNNGNIILVHSLEGIVEIYNQLNQKVYENSFYSLPLYNEQNIKIEITNNGLVILVSENQVNGIFIINNNGNSISSQTIINGLVSGLSASKDGNYIAISLFNWEIDILKNETIIINLKKNTSTTYPIRFNHGEFSLNSNLFLAFTNKQSFYIDLIEQKVLWKNNLDNSHIYLDGTIEEEKAILIQSINPILENNAWIFTGASIMSFDRNKEMSILNNISSSFNKIELNKQNEDLYVKVDKNIIQIDKN